MRHTILLLFFTLILGLPSYVGAYEAKEMLAATDHFGGDQDLTGIVQVMPKGTTVLYCELDLTAIAGTVPTFQLYIVACDAEFAAAETCTDHPQITAWYKGTQVGVPTNERIIIVPRATAGADAGMSDVEKVGHLPTLWAAFGSQAGVGLDVTVSFTVDCVWY